MEDKDKGGEDNKRKSRTLLYKGCGGTFVRRGGGEDRIALGVCVFCVLKYSVQPWDYLRTNSSSHRKSPSHPSSNPSSASRVEPEPKLDRDRHTPVAKHLFVCGYVYVMIKGRKRTFGGLEETPCMHAYNFFFIKLGSREKLAKATGNWTLDLT